MTAEVLDRFARGDLADGELFEVVNHLQTCPSCARVGQARAATDVRALRNDLTAPPQRVNWLWASIAAAVLAIAILSVLFLVRREEPHPQKPPPVVRKPPLPQTTTTDAGTYADPEWERLVASASDSGRLPFPPYVDELRAPIDVLRGGSETVDLVSPAGVVIDDVRPRFTWPAARGGSYVVFVFDGETEVAHSSSLTTPSWMPSRDLPRGRTLTWQVEVTSGDRTIETIPSPPAPQAMFRIISAEDQREIERARASHGDDTLLLSVLYARSGMRDEAIAFLRRAAESGSSAARRILAHETARRKRSIQDAEP